MVTLGARISLRTFNSLHFDVFVWIFERMVDFHELFCEGLSALRKYALIVERICDLIVHFVIKA